jgi:hypothetical protein
MKKRMFLTVILLASVACSVIPNFAHAETSSAAITFINTDSKVLIYVSLTADQYACQPGEDVLIRLGARNTGSVSLDLYVVLKIYAYQGGLSPNAGLIYDSTSSGEDQEIHLAPGDVSSVIEFHWTLPSAPIVPAYSICVSLEDAANRQTVYDKLGGPDSWFNAPMLHVPYDNQQTDSGAAIINWMGDAPETDMNDEVVKEFASSGFDIATDIATRHLAMSLLAKIATDVGLFVIGYIMDYATIANPPNIAKVKAVNIIDGSIDKEIEVFGQAPVPITICFTPSGDIDVTPLQIKIEKETGFLQPRQLISTISVSGHFYIGGMHMISLKEPFIPPSPGTYHIVVEGCSEDIGGLTASEAIVDAQPSVVQGVFSNIVPNGCATMTFEGGADGNVIYSSISGMKFTTTLGYDWIYGDKTTNQYNVYPYGSGAYICDGNVFAWLGPNMGTGRIDFSWGTASYFSVLTSTYSGVAIDAYDSNDNLIASSGWAPSNTFTYTFTRLTVEAPGISYILIHDTGNYWLIDDLVTNAPSLTFSPMSDNLQSNIGQGQTQSWVVDVGPVPTDFTAKLTWGGSKLDLFAFDPSGTMYPSTLFAPNELHIAVHNGMPGLWLLTVYGEDIPTGPEEYSLGVSLGADTIPPTTKIAIGQPQYTDSLGNVFITSATLLTLTAQDDSGGSGVASIGYRIRSTNHDFGWTTSTTQIDFYMTGFADGTYFIDYNSTDAIGNVEPTNTATLILDNTPPTTNPTIGDPKYVSGRTYVTPDTPFTLTATDAGSGVKLTTYRINSSSYDSGWLTYTNPISLNSLSDGNCTISFNSSDNVENVEATHRIDVTLFSWSYVFKDSDGRGTILKINTAYKFFQFIAPNKDFGIKYDAKMIQLCKQVIIICYEDKQMRIGATAVDARTCSAIAWDKQTCKTYLLIAHPPSYTLTVYCKGTNGKPISGASIYLNGCCKGRTDANGKLSITNVLAGTYTVTARKCGYKDTSISATISSDTTITITMK